MEQKLRKHPEIYYNFLSQLNDRDLTNMCKVNEEIRYYCDSNYLWSLKIDRLYQGFPIPLQYIDNKRILYYLLKYLSLLDIVCLAADIGDIKLLNWLWKQKLDFDDIVGNTNIHYFFENRIAKGDKNLKLWSEEHGFNLDNESICFSAIEYNNFDLADELAEKVRIPTSNIWEYNLKKGNLPALKWLYQRYDNVELEIDLLEDCILSIKKGWFDIFRWFIEELNVIPTVEMANHAASPGRMIILKYLAKLDLYPDFQGWNAAFSSFQYEVLAWMSAEGKMFITTDEMHDPYRLLEYYVEHYDLVNANKLLKSNYFPDQEIVDNSVTHFNINSIRMLDLLAKYDIYPSRIAANRAKINGDFETLKWLLEHDIFPIED